MFDPMQLCFEDRTGRTFAMYRIIVSFLLYTSAVTPAPQDSNVTFVKIQPYVETNTSQVNRTRVENVPITISTFNNLPLNISKEEKTKNTIELKELTVSLDNEYLRHVRSDDVTTEIDQSEATTELETTDYTTYSTTVLPKTTTKRPTPKFSSKLTHLKKSKKSTLTGDSINTIERIEKPYRRKFKSRCRCAKIEHCTKLQITVPRCPNEYFLCCF